MLCLKCNGVGGALYTLLSTLALPLGLLLTGAGTFTQTWQEMMEVLCSTVRTCCDGIIIFVIKFVILP